jgi:hypothetical protein
LHCVYPVAQGNFFIEGRFESGPIDK